MYENHLQQRPQYASGLFGNGASVGGNDEMQRASAASLFPTGFNQNVSQQSQYQFDSFVNDSQQGQNFMSLPSEESTIIPPPTFPQNRSGPPSLTNAGNQGNPFRSQARRGHSTRTPNTASSFFGNPAAVDGFTPASFAPSNSSSDYFSNLPNAPVQFPSAPNIMPIQQPQEFCEYPSSEISDDKRKKAELERAAKIADREQNLAKVNEKREAMINSQNEQWRQIEKEKEQEALLSSFTNEKGPLDLFQKQASPVNKVKKPLTKEERKEMRDRAKHMRMKLSDRTNHAAGDLSSLYDEISSRGASVCSDLSDKHQSSVDGFHQRTDPPSVIPYPNLSANNQFYHAEPGTSSSVMNPTNVVDSSTASPSQFFDGQRFQQNFLGYEMKNNEFQSPNKQAEHSNQNTEQQLNKLVTSEDNSSGSSYDLAQKSSSSDSQLSPYELVDKVNYPSQSSSNSNDSSPLEFLQNVSVASSSYEKVSVPSSSISFDMSGVETNRFNGNESTLQTIPNIAANMQPFTESTDQQAEMFSPSHSETMLPSTSADAETYIPKSSYNSTYSNLTPHLHTQDVDIPANNNVTMTDEMLVNQQSVSMQPLKNDATMSFQPQALPTSVVNEVSNQKENMTVVSNFSGQFNQPLQNQMDTDPSLFFSSSQEADMQAHSILQSNNAPMFVASPSMTSVPEPPSTQQYNEQFPSQCKTDIQTETNIPGVDSKSLETLSGMSTVTSSDQNLYYNQDNRLYSIQNNEFLQQNHNPMNNTQQSSSLHTNPGFLPQNAAEVPSVPSVSTLFQSNDQSPVFVQSSEKQLPNDNDMLLANPLQQSNNVVSSDYQPSIGEHHSPVTSLGFNSTSPNNSIPATGPMQQPLHHGNVHATGSPNYYMPATGPMPQPLPHGNLHTTPSPNNSIPATGPVQQPLHHGNVHTTTSPNYYMPATGPMQQSIHHGNFHATTSPNNSIPSTGAMQQSLPHGSESARTIMDGQSLSGPTLNIGINKKSTASEPEVDKNVIKTSDAFMFFKSDKQINEKPLLVSSNVPSLSAGQQVPMVSPQPSAQSLPLHQSPQSLPSHQSLQSVAQLQKQQTFAPQLQSSQPLTPQQPQQPLMPQQPFQSLPPQQPLQVTSQQQPRQPLVSPQPQQQLSLQQPPPLASLQQPSLSSTQQPLQPLVSPQSQQQLSLQQPLPLASLQQPSLPSTKQPLQPLVSQQFQQQLLLQQPQSLSSMQQPSLSSTQQPQQQLQPTTIVNQFQPYGQTQSDLSYQPFATPVSSSLPYSEQTDTLSNNTFPVGFQYSQVPQSSQEPNYISTHNTGTTQSNVNSVTSNSELSAAVDPSGIPTQAQQANSFIQPPDQQLAQQQYQPYGMPYGQNYNDMHQQMYWQHYHQQQMWYANYYNQQYYDQYQQYGYPYWGMDPNYDQYSYHSSAASSMYGDSRPGSVIERRSSGTDDQILNELADLTSEMSFQNRPETPPQEELIPRTTPLSFTRPHVKARFSMTAGILSIVAPKQPLDGEIAFIQNIPVTNIAPNILMTRFPGPLVRKETHKKHVRNFIMETIRDHLPRLHVEPVQLFSHIALWEFVNLLVKQNGTFDGSDVADLLVGLLPVTEVNGIESRELSSLANPPQNVSSDELEEFHTYISTGRTKDALDIAIRSGLWGHAFMLSYSLGEKWANHVQNRFLIGLQKTDPMKTLYAHLQNKDLSYIKKRANPETWVQNLCVLISQGTNQPDRDREKIVVFGDALREQGLIAAAQLCYLVARQSFGKHTSREDRLVLLGLEHQNYTEKPGRLLAKDLHVQLTEIYQYALTLHDQSYVIPSFQPYKFDYAMQLIECGYSSEGLAYLESIGIAINNDCTYTLYKSGFVMKLVKLVEQLLLVEVDKYEELEEIPWLQNLKRYCERAVNTVSPDEAGFNNMMSGRMCSSTNLSDPAHANLTSPELVTDWSASSNDLSSRNEYADNSTPNAYNDIYSKKRAHESNENYTLDSTSYQHDEVVPKNGMYSNNEFDSTDGSYEPSPRTAIEPSSNNDTYESDSRTSSAVYGTNTYDYTDYGYTQPIDPKNPSYEGQHVAPQLNNDGYDHSEQHYHYDNSKNNTTGRVDDSAYQDPYNPNQQPQSAYYSGEQYNQATQPSFFNPAQFTNSEEQPGTSDAYSYDNQFANPEQHQRESFTAKETYPEEHQRESFTAKEIYPEEEEVEDLFGNFTKKKNIQGAPTANVSKNDVKSTTAPAKGQDPKEKSKGWFGGILSKFSRKNDEAHLPDDKDKSLVYDKNLERWVDKNADPAEVSKSLPPPPPMAASPNLTRPSMDDGPKVPPPMFGQPTTNETPEIASEASVPPVQLMGRVSAKQAAKNAMISRRNSRNNMAAKNEEEKKPSGPPSKFSLKAQGGRRGAGRYVNVMGNATKSTPMAPVLDPFSSISSPSGNSNQFTRSGGTNMPMTFFDPSKMSNQAS